jgi:glycosyltransferase involved in cell wall biosynthesis
LRVGLNLLHALPEIGGGWNYIRSLVRGLARVDSEDTFVAFVTRESESLVPARPNFQAVRVDIRSSIRAWRVAFENTALVVMARKRRLDCLHWFSGTQALIEATPSAVTCYDLHPFLRLGPYSPVKRLYLKFMVAEAVRRAGVLLPMSEATATDLEKILGASRSRMVVIPPVLEDEIRPAAAVDAERFRERHRLPERFWLYVAHFHPHKNHLRLLEAYRRLAGEGPAWPLVFRGDDKGSKGEVEKLIPELGLEDTVIFLPRLEAADLPLLYSAATALVFPSLYEGGGLPVVEAMACGLPVAASRIPPVMEFAGDAAVGFNPADVSSIAAAMRELAGDAGVRNIKRREGLDRAGDFRAEAVIPRLLDAYARAAAKR